MDKRVCIIRDDRYLEHKTGRVHPENPNRLKAVYAMIDEQFPDHLTFLEPKPATVQELELVHTPTYILKVQKTAQKESTRLAGFTPASSQTYMAARLAVGGCLKALESLMLGHCHTAFALIRPPGHHAKPDKADGFCIFNNIGITARKAQKVYGLKRILVLDWDIHHGDGIQDLFYREKELFYFSTHCMGFFPDSGFAEDTGEGSGLGYNVNISVPKELKDEDILHCYREVVALIIRRYRPELIIVAAGFDGHHRDPLGRTGLTEHAYGWLTRLIMNLKAEIGGPPIFFSLEGGYDIKALIASTREVLAVLTEKESQFELPVSFTPIGEELVAEATKIHSKYGVWVGKSPE